MPMERLRILVVALCMGAGETQAQGVISTLAGTDWVFPADGQPAIQAPLANVEQMRSDAQGNLYLPDADQNYLFRIGFDGRIEVLAGTGAPASRGDNGPARLASLHSPRGIVLDGAGNLYVSEYLGHRIRRISPDGQITTIAGTGAAGFAGDGGPATAARLNNPTNLEVDSRGVLYVLDTSNARIRRIDPGGTISTIAGTGTSGFSGDGGPATAAQIQLFRGLAIDPGGNLYFSSGSRIRRIDGSGTITTVVGNGVRDFAIDGAAATATPLRGPGGLAFDAQRRLVFAESDGYRVRRVTSAGTIGTVAGSGTFGYDGDGLAAFQAAMGFPRSLAIDPGGNLFVYDQFCTCIRRVNTRGVIQTAAGNGSYGRVPDSSPASQAYVFAPRGLAFDGDGNLLVANQGLDRIGMITPAGAYREVAGEAAGCCRDGLPARQALISDPNGMALDAAGRVYFSEFGFDLIRRIDRDGTIRTFAGNRTSGFSGDGGPATSAAMNDPAGLAFDSGGNLYVAEFNGRRIRRITPEGTISTFAGDGQNRYAGDGGPAAAASFRNPYGLAITRSGDILVTDLFDHRIRRIVPDGTISTIAGDGRAASSGDGGPAAAASVNTPSGLAVDRDGSILVLERDGNRVRRIAPDGIITTIAGNGTRGYSGDGGPSPDAAFSSPLMGIAVSPQGNVVVADSLNNRLRVFRREQPRISVEPGGLSFSVAAGQTSEPLPIQVQSDLPGLPFEVRVAAGADWLFVIPARGRAPDPAQVFVDAGLLAPGHYQATLEVRAPGAQPESVTVPVNVRVN